MTEQCTFQHYKKQNGTIYGEFLVADGPVSYGNYTIELWPQDIVKKMSDSQRIFNDRRQFDKVIKYWPTSESMCEGEIKFPRNNRGKLIRIYFESR